jgi:hypothetical protein
MQNSHNDNYTAKLVMFVTLLIFCRIKDLNNDSLQVKEGMDKNQKCLEEQDRMLAFG